MCSRRLPAEHGQELFHLALAPALERLKELSFQVRNVRLMPLDMQPFHLRVAPNMHTKTYT